MRSTLLFLALATPSLALTTPTSMPVLTNPPASRPAKTQVSVTFFNSMTRPCKLHVDQAVYKLPAGGMLSVHARLGSTVEVDSEMNTQFHKTLLVSAADEGRFVPIQ